MANRLHQPHVPLPEIHWSPNEQWVWRKTQRGEHADLNERYGVELVAWEDEAWNKEERTRRLIRPAFLYTVLLYEPWRSALSHFGLCISGAVVEEPIEMPFAGIGHEFWLLGCRIESGIMLYGAIFTHGLILRECSVNGEANFALIKTGGSLLLDESRLGKTELSRANVGGDFSAINATFKEEMGCDRANFQGGVFIRDSRFDQDLRLIRTNVSGSISINGSRIAGKLVMDSSEVKAGLFMRGCHFVGGAMLPGVSVGGEISLDKSVFTESLIIQRAVIRNEIFMRQTEFAEDVPARIVFSDIGGNLQLEGAKFNRLDLTGTNAQAVVDNKMEWPDKLKLDHFTYQHVGGLGEGYGGDHMLERPASWFVDWLAKHKPYSPQPYEQCAKVLREAGQPGKAKEVLYQGKERERNEPNGDFRRWVWLTASKWLLGHGLTWRFALVPAAWAVGVLLLGWLIFCQTPYLSKDHSVWWGLGYSLSKLIPLVSFGNDISDLPVASFAARAWFTFQTLFGWFLASLIVAGLAGVGRPGGKS